MATQNSILAKVYQVGNHSGSTAVAGARALPANMGFSAHSHFEDCVKLTANGADCYGVIHYGGDLYYVVETATQLAALANT